MRFVSGLSMLPLKFKGELLISTPISDPSMHWRSLSFIRTVILGLIFWAILGHDAIAKEDDRAIYLFVSDEPPSGVKSTDWHNAVFRTCVEWYRCPGIPVVVTEDRWRANLLVEVADLDRPVAPRQGPALGYCYHGENVQFPHIPGVDGPPVLIQINRWLRNYPGASLKRTLLHEFGHSVGLDHQTQSVMSVGTRRHFELTQEDKRLQEILARKISRLDTLKVSVSYKGLGLTSGR